jgi:hypothetical protein
LGILLNIPVGDSIGVVEVLQILDMMNMIAVVVVVVVELNILKHE